MRYSNELAADHERRLAFNAQLKRLEVRLNPMSVLMKHIDRAVAAIQAADGLLITAGAGMGVDSGLPDFRGNEGFWAAYPALGKSRTNFRTIASPAAFLKDPHLAWGFYGHRLKLYRDTQPHAGFAILQRIASQMPHGAFVYTSNVDGQFQKAGFSEMQVCECHGSIHHLQCLSPRCESSIWPAGGFLPRVDVAACRLESPLPRCSACGSIARPNILMFNDGDWLEQRTDRQTTRLRDWLAKVEKLVVIELGAGTAIPTVRHFGERAGGTLIRINPTEAQIGKPTAVSLKLGALAGLELLASSSPP